MAKEGLRPPETVTPDSVSASPYTVPIIVIPALCRDPLTRNLLQIALQYFAFGLCPLGSMPCLSQGIYDKGGLTPSLKPTFSQSTKAFIQGFSVALRILP